MESIMTTQQVPPENFKKTSPQDLLAFLRAKTENRSLALVDSDYFKAQQAQQAFEDSLNPEPSVDVEDFDGVAMDRYLTGEEDKRLGWKYLALYESFGIAKTLADRIARLRKEIKDDRARGLASGDVHSQIYLSSMLELVQRHDALTNWVARHRDRTIICFSDDPSDLDAYGLGYCNTYDGRWGEMTKCAAIVGATIEKHGYKVAFAEFEDATMWEYAGGILGSDRYYVAFKDKEAEHFRLQISPFLTLWKDVPRVDGRVPREAAAPDLTETEWNAHLK
jgi:hypothetical protein